jgi:hypothetical protein
MGIQWAEGKVTGRVGDAGIASQGQRTRNAGSILLVDKLETKIFWINWQGRVTVTARVATT